MGNKYQGIKRLVLDYFEEMERCTPDEAAKVLKKYTADSYTWEGPFPFLDQEGVDAVAEVFWKPLKESMKYMQRRQDVFMAGTATDGKEWVMSMGWFMGLYDEELLNIPVTCKMHHLQYAEYSCVEDGKITHTAMFVDLIGFMREAELNPLPPETGHYFIYPGPRDHNGLMFEDAPYEKAEKSFKVVDDMIKDLIALNSGNETPRDLLKKSWHDDMIWYGPAGIGASYSIPRYQMQNQMPFRKQLIDKAADEINAYFAEGDFVCFYASMSATATGGWLGLPSSGRSGKMRGDIDIYYIKDGKISENWCFIDIPYYLNDLGLNIFERTTRILNPKDPDGEQKVW